MYISLIIPVYNDRNGLNRLLQSIYSQEKVDRSYIEVIIVDDGSTVKYNDIISQYDLPIVFLQQDNGRQGKARNYGLSKATGDFVWFLDADDDIPFTALSKICKKILDDNTLEILFFNANYDNSLLKSFQTGCSKKELLTNLSKNIFTVAPWNKVYKRSFLDKYKIKFPEKLKYEDLYFSIMTVIKADKIKYFDTEIYNYYKNTGSTTNNHNKSVIDVFYVINKLFLDTRGESSINDIKNDLLFIHGIKYTIIRLIESKSLPLVLYVLSNKQFKLALNHIKLGDLIFTERCFIKALKILSACCPIRKLR
jgi:glycosyltransferase involved in cell wall biosynthesis